MIEGQYLDLSFEERLDIRVEAYLKMVERKTAALFEGAAWMGASLGTEDEELVTALRGYGKELGFAFQIRDDILDSYEDIRDGKPFSPNEVFFSGRDSARKKLFTYVNSAVKALDEKSIASDELRYLALKLLEVRKHNGE